jgi:hopanoid biosynthesis associated RND transporter like protein HpnN
MKLEMQSDQLELISRDHPLIRLTERLEPFKVRTPFTVVIEAPTPDRALAYLHALAPRIEADAVHFQEVSYRVDADRMMKWGLLFLTESDLRHLQEQLDRDAELIQGLSQQPDILSFLRIVNREMASHMVGELFTGFLMEGNAVSDGNPSGREPMDLDILIRTLESMSSYLNGSPDYKSPWTSFFKGASWEQDGYFWTSGKRFLLLQVKPNHFGSFFDESYKPLVRLRELIRETSASFPDVEAGVTGQKVINMDEMVAAMEDMAWATWISFFGVWLIMIVFLRSIRRPFLELTSLSVALCWTFGWTTLFIGHLNILSLVFAPMLCGIGVDYGIYWLTRYEEEERDASLDRNAVVRRVVHSIGPGIIHAEISTAFAFFPLALTGFGGLVELGVISGMGILFGLLADLTVLPTLVFLAGGRRKKESAMVGSPVRRDFIRFSRWSAGIVLGGAGIVSVVCLISAIRVSFDVNPLRLQDQSAESVIWEHKLIERSTRSTLFASVLASSLDEVARKSKELEALPSVLETESILTMLPKRQEAKIKLIRDAFPVIPDLPPDNPGSQSIDIDAGRLSGILERIGFKMQSEQADKWGADKPLVAQMNRVRDLAEELTGILNGGGVVSQRLLDFQARFRQDMVRTMDLLKEGSSAEPMRMEDIPQSIRDRFYNNGSYLIRVYPRGSIWEKDALARFVNEVRSVAPDVVGDPVSLFVFADAFRKACLSATLYAMIAIIILLTAPFRSFSLFLIAFTPLGIGGLWTLGIMGASGVDFNLANGIFLPLVFGAGVEYALIILYRWREGKTQPGHLPYSTAKGIILAALTTTTGFGALMISSHRGIFSLGYVAFVGSLCILVVAVLLVPAILRFKTPPEIKSEEK